MNAIPVYTAENFTLAEYKGYSYPLLFNMAVAEKLERIGNGLDGFSEKMKNNSSRSEIIAIFLNEAVEIAAFFGRTLPRVNPKEIVLFSTPFEIRTLREAIETAIIKAVPNTGEAKTDTDEAWTPEEEAELEGLNIPAFSNEEKNS